MLEEHSRQDILSLMKQHDLDHEQVLFENDLSDIDKISQTLIKAYVKTEDPDFFLHFYRLIYPQLTERATFLIRGMGANQIFPEDIVSEAFSIILNLFYDNRLETVSDPFPYLNRIVRNLVYSALLKKKRVKEFSQYTIEDDEYISFLDKVTQIEENDRRVLYEDVLREMALGKYKGLADREMYIFNSFYVDNLSAEEIAEQLQVSRHAIYKTLYRTKQKVKKQIGYFKSPETGKGKA